MVVENGKSCLQQVTSTVEFRVVEDFTNPFHTCLMSLAVVVETRCSDQSPDETAEIYSTVDSLLTHTTWFEPEGMGY